MKISIITVCKNAAYSIEKTLLSIYGQTYKNIEHIVIDGVSTDGTIGILSKYKENISILVSEPDSGIYNAMNKALEMVTGDVVYFLNATDTLYDENVLEKVVQEFQTHSDLELLWGDIQFTQNDKDVNIATFENINIKSDMMYKNPCHQAIFYKNNLFVKNGCYNENLPILADHELNARMLVLKNARCEYFPLVLARFALGGISTSTNEEIHLRRKAERVAIYKANFHQDVHFRLDRFFTQMMGSLTKLIKNSALFSKLFVLYDNFLKKFFKTQLSLNKI